MALSLVKQSDRVAGLPVFHCYVSSPLLSGEDYWPYFKVAAVSATDACLKAAYRAVRDGFISRGESVDIFAETTAESCAHHPCVCVKRTVSPSGRTGGAA